MKHQDTKKPWWQRLLRFENAWLLLILVCGITMVFAMPPFQVMDEYKHFYKSYAVAQGDLLCTQSPKEGPGFYIPTAIRDAGKIMGVDGLPYNYDQKITAEELARGTRVTDLGAPVFVQHPFCETPVWAAAPQALGIKIAQVLSLPLDGMFYAGRLVSLLITIAIIYVALRLMPFGKSLMGFVTLLPMFVQQIASYSQDSMHYALILLFIAAVLHLAQQKKPLQKKTMGWLAALSMIAVYTKFGYMPLVLLILLLPQRLFASRKQYWLYMGGVLVLHALTFVALRSIFTAGDIVNAGGIDRDGQLLWILQHPLEYAGVLAHTLDVHFEFYWKNVFGILGWLDYKLFGIHYILLGTLMLFLVGAQDKEEPVPFSAWQRWLMLGLALGTGLLLMTILYAIDDTIGSPIISLMQGKYFLPLLPLVLLSLYQLRVSAKTRRIAVIVVAIIGFPMLFLAQQARYYDEQLVDAVPYVPDTVTMQSVSGQQVFKQIFVSRQDNLQGISFWIGNKEQVPDSAIGLLLKDRNCEEILDSGYIREGDIAVDGYYHYRFPEIAKSKDQQFCLQVNPTLRDEKIPVQLGVTKTDTFRDGRATLNDEPVTGDLVMKLAYRR